MTKYKVGNILRGYAVVDAETPQEAWILGCAAFNKAFPTDENTGRHVHLDYYEARPPIYSGNSVEPYGTRKQP